MRTKSIAILFCSFLLFACTRTMILYPREARPISKGKISIGAGSRGKIEITLYDGEHFKGQYVAVPHGSAFGFGLMNTYGGAGAHASASGFGFSQSLSGSAQAVLTGDRGSTIRCEVLYNSDYHGYGICQASDGRVFDVQF